jgi:hypothetical protein
MFGIVMVYGIISGAIVISVILGGLLLGKDTPIFHSEVFGYAVMIIALSAIFFGVKRYRDRELGGVIKFLPAFLLGLAIAVVAGVIYVGTWELYLMSTNYTFMSEFSEGYIAKQQAAGLSPDEIAKLKVQMAEMVEMYKNPLFRFGITFIEIFPVGFLISLISALVLRNSKVLPDHG